MNPWEIIGWAIAVPLVSLSALYVYAVSAAVVRVIVNRSRPRQTVSKGRHLRAVD